MQELVILMLAAIALAWAADNISVKRLDNGRMHRQVLFSVILFLLLALFIGLRIHYNDTGTYRLGYEKIAAFPEYWEKVKLKLGDNFGYGIINAWLKTNGLISQDFLMFWALLVTGLYVLFLHKHSTNYALTIFLLFTTGIFTFMCAAIKQTAAVGLCVLGIHLFLKRKYLPYVLMVILASTIHPYSLMFLFAPLFTYKPWTGKTYFFIILFVAAGLALQPLMGTIINITTMIGEEYTIDEFSEAGVNIFRVLVCNVPLVLSFVYRRELFADSTKEQDLFVNLSMLNGAIMFVGLFGTANYFGRLANYFLIFQTISIPWMLDKLPRQKRQLLKIAMVVCYFAYFYYSSAINQPFDELFSRYSLGEYLTLPR